MRAGPANIKWDMPVHNFMLADLEGSAAAICLFALFALVPGFAVAWLTDLFEFRRRTPAFRVALSIPLSIALCPAGTYLAGRFGSMAAVWAIYGISWIYALVIAARHFRGGAWLPAKSWVVFAILGTWAVIVLFSLIDLQVGARDWFPSAAFDYSIRAQFINSVGATGIPPANPFFLPGHTVPLRYHYFWLMLCALVSLAGGPLVTARHAWIGGSVWAGAGLMSLVALYFRLFLYRGAATFRRRAITGILLLTVTGLDVVPTAGLWVLQARGMHAVLPAMEWWNEQIGGFLYTGLWSSHYLCGICACMLAFLMLWDTEAASGRRRACLAGLAGVAIASAAGISIYICFVFAVFLCLWTANALRAGRLREVGTLAASGAIGLVLSLPYLLSLRGSGGGGPPLQAWVRPFQPLDALFRVQASSGPWVLAAANGLALPLNYFLELGFFFFAALLWWKKHRRSGEPFTRAESAIGLLILSTVLICTFLRSSVIGNNDLGWRGFLLAQFGLLLLSVDVLSDWKGFATRGERAFLVGLLVIGALGSAYEIAINRFYAPLADRGTVNTLSWIADDHHAGERTYAAREAAEWADRQTGRGAVVQFNPHVAVQDTAAYLYSSRRMVAGDDHCLSVFGGDPSQCAPLIATLNQIYPLAGQAAVSSLDNFCRALPIDFVAASDTDPEWNDRASWVWTARPDFANRYVRMFRCARAY